MYFKTKGNMYLIIWYPSFFLRQSVGLICPLFIFFPPDKYIVCFVFHSYNNGLLIFAEREKMKQKQSPTSFLIIEFIIIYFD